MKWLLPIVLIGVAVGSFVVITQPIYAEILTMQEEADAYAKALDNSAELQKERDRLTKKYNSFSVEDMDRLLKMLPNTVDNIQLILEIQEEAAKRGIIVRNVEFEPEQFAAQTPAAEDTLSNGTVTIGQASQAVRDEAKATQATSTRRATEVDDGKPYETFELEFSVEGSYKDFISFMKLMEKSLRLVDINSISFTPGTSEKDKVYTDNYRYLFRINTYRLKD